MRRICFFSVLIGVVSSAACGGPPEELSTPQTALIAVGPVNVGFNAAEGLDDTLSRDMAAFIDTSTGSLDLAIYKITAGNVTESIINAHDRGVRVRMVSDTVHRNLADSGPVYDLLEAAGIPIVYDIKTSDMHHKFIVRDGTSVWMGSYNPLFQFPTHAENALTIDDASVAAAFTREFEEMHVEGKFSNSKADDTQHLFDVGATQFEVYFSPKDGVEERVVRAISTAKESIHFLAFSFSADPVADAMIERHTAGVAVSGAIERLQANKRGGDFARLLAAGADVRKTPFSTFMHHKVIIVDAGTPDAVLITGSYNFTTKADERNDESIAVIHSQEVAAIYLNEMTSIFDRCSRLLGDGDVADTFRITEVHANAIDESKGELIEIVNVSSSAASLEGLYVSDGDASDRIIPFDGLGYTIDGGAVAVIIDPNYENLQLIPAGVRIFTVENTTLGDGLTNSDAITLYGSDAANPFDTYSFPFNPGNGYSVVRTALDAPDLASTWVAGRFQHGSPGIFPEPLDLNTADAVALDTLPRIGPTLAARIVADRSANGLYCATDDLTRVSGIGLSTVDGFRHLALARGPDGCGAGPVELININTADATELDTLPKIGPTLAGRIVLDRATNGPFATTHDITRVSGIGESIHGAIAKLITVD